MMRRPQFSLRALLVAMLVVAAFFGGMALQRQFDSPVYAERDASDVLIVPGSPSQTMTMPDGSSWLRLMDRE